MLYDGYMWFNNHNCGYTMVIIDSENDVGAWHITEDLDEGIFICTLVPR